MKIMKCFWSAVKRQLEMHAQLLASSACSLLIDSFGMQPINGNSSPCPPTCFFSLRWRLQRMPLMKSGCLHQLQNAACRLASIQLEAWCAPGIIVLC